MHFRRIFLVSLFFASLGLAACGSDAPEGGGSCSTDNDCQLGTVCSASNACVSASCDFCTVSQVCYKASPSDEGSCSKPECSGDSDCAKGFCNKGLCEAGGSGDCTKNEDCKKGEKCDITDKCVPDTKACTTDMDCSNGKTCVEDQCVGGCEDNTDCADTEYCAASGSCETGCQDNASCEAMGHVCTEGKCACDATSCPEGKACLATGNCGDPTNCDQVVCPDDQVCNSVDFSCIPKCSADSCNANEACNVATGICEITNCPGEDPTQCDPNSARPAWDPIKCFCAECLQDSECNMAAGEVCTNGGKCFACEKACDGSAGSCGGATPYCISECCVSCVSANDCMGGELCIDGACSPPPNCMADPTVCPAGTSCDANGQCTTVGGGSQCDPNDPMSCPAPGFCDPQSGTCENPFGGGDCGLCGPMVNNVCSCPGGNTCSTDLIPICGCDFLASPECPNGASCVPILNICL